MSCQIYDWTGELAEYAAAFDGMTMTGRYSILSQTFVVPTREDYEAALRVSGDLPRIADLRAHPHLVAAVQAHWHASGHNACVFAAYMSAARDDNGWETVVLGDAGSPEEEAVALGRIVAPRLIAARAEVVSVLLPHRDQPSDIARLLRRLEQLSGWSITDEGVEADEECTEVVRLGVRVLVDFGFVSEVLGFGPCSTYGATRRAPFTELVIRAKPPTKRPKHNRAFIAHYKIPGQDASEMNVWWTQTMANRVARLGPDHNERAKARVTLVLPKAIWIPEGK